MPGRFGSVHSHDARRLEELETLSKEIPFVSADDANREDLLRRLERDKEAAPFHLVGVDAKRFEWYSVP